MDLFYFITSTLAVWRITHLVVKEDGPFDIVFLIRRKVTYNFFAAMLDCFYCFSVWAAIPFAIWIGTLWPEKLLLWLALSGAACLLEQATTRFERSEPTKYEED